MERIFNIIGAWYRVLTSKTTKEHKRREAICNMCPYARYKKYLDFIDDDLKEVKGFVCTKCGCPLLAKIRSNDNCPLNKW